MVAEAERTLRTVIQLPSEVQRAIASDVARSVFQAIREIERTPGPSSIQRDRVIKAQIANAVTKRHQAIENGATSDEDPNWSTAALIESWLVANSGVAGREAGKHITELILGWAGSVLSEAELSEIEDAITP